MRIKNFNGLFSILFVVSVIIFSSIRVFASDSARLDDSIKKLTEYRKDLTQINEIVLDSDINDTKLTISRHKLKAIENEIDEESAYYKKTLEDNKLLLSDLTSLGLSDKDITKNGQDYLSTNINEINSDIEKESKILIEFRLFTKELNDTLDLISEKKIKIRNKELFIYNIPFYRGQAWGQGRKDIIEYFIAKGKAFPEFIDVFCKTGVKITFAFVTLFVCLILFINFRPFSRFIKKLLDSPIKKGHTEVTRYSDILHTRGLIILLLIIKNSLIPSLMILALHHSFYMNYGYESSNKWFALVWNITTTLVYFFYVHNITNIFFNKKLELLPPLFIESRRFKRRCLIMVYQFAILFTLNDINIMNVSISIYPIFSQNGTALLNLIMGITISYNFLILTPKVKQYLRSPDTKNDYQHLYIALLNILNIGSLILPIMVFVGASNLFTGIIHNITQCFLVIYFLYLIYSIFRNIHPILSRSIVSFMYKVSAENEEDEEKISHIDHKTPIFTYWFNFTIIVIFSILGIIFFLLIWGVPPDVVGDWINTILFKGIPLGSQSTFPLSYLLQAIVLSIVTYYIFKGIQNLAEKKVLPYTSMDSGTQKAVITTIGYLGIAASVITFIYALGVSLTALTFIISGLSVGIGFALQEFFKNFFSGFVLLIERPIKVGDILLYNGEIAEVKKIRVRSTELLSASRATLIVPNSELVNNTVVNDSINPTSLVTIRVGVSYDAEPDEVIKILSEAASSTDNVFHKPSPTVDVHDFADSAIIYDIKAFTKRSVKASVASAIRKNIFLKLKEANIEIPYPQTTIHLKNIPDTNNSKLEAPGAESIKHTML